MFRERNCFIHNNISHFATNLSTGFPIMRPEFSWGALGTLVLVLSKRHQKVSPSRSISGAAFGCRSMGSISCGWKRRPHNSAAVTSGNSGNMLRASRLFQRNWRRLTLISWKGLSRRARAGLSSRRWCPCERRSWALWFGFWLPFFRHRGAVP